MLVSVHDRNTFLYIHLKFKRNKIKEDEEAVAAAQEEENMTESNVMSTNARLYIHLFSVPV